MIIQSMKEIMRASFLLAIAFLAAAAVFAQSNTGSITGVVTDQNGAVVPNASVTVINQGTSERRTVQADAEGRYDVPSLSTGGTASKRPPAGFR